MNNSGPRWQNPRNQALVDAVYASLLADSIASVNR